jgi:hypothetical protein
MILHILQCVLLVSMSGHLLHLYTGQPLPTFSILSRLSRGQVRTKWPSPALLYMLNCLLQTLGKSLHSWDLFSHRAWHRIQTFTQVGLRTLWARISKAALCPTGASTTGPWTSFEWGMGQSSFVVAAESQENRRRSSCGALSCSPGPGAGDGEPR